MPLILQFEISSANQPLVGLETLVTLGIALAAVIVSHCISYCVKKCIDRGKRKKLLESIRNDLFVVLKDVVDMLTNHDYEIAGEYININIYDLSSPILSECLTGTLHYIRNDLPQLTQIYRYTTRAEKTREFYSGTVRSIFLNSKVVDSENNISIDHHRAHIDKYRQFSEDTAIKLIQICKTNLEFVGFPINVEIMNDYLRSLDTEECLSEENISKLKELWHEDE